MEQELPMVTITNKGKDTLKIIRISKKMTIDVSFDNSLEIAKSIIMSDEKYTINLFSSDTCIPADINIVNSETSVKICVGNDIHYFLSFESDHIRQLIYLEDIYDGKEYIFE